MIQLFGESNMFYTGEASWEKADVVSVNWGIQLKSHLDRTAADAGIAFN
jgi:hypothetical protein